ncbi:MAG: tryptophan synthase subunit alpha [Geobacteraceae bacterium GWC2_48_7]|nr:MAG: tryptophan synthase subunit alpha [Geobacteraceae bacterium GWC2_48_7]
MQRLETRFKELEKNRQKALITFITAGDPDLATTEQMIHTLEKAGADIIELGMPFSDPMADGPVIQLASERALAAGTTLTEILATVGKVRVNSQIPIILMGYLNPIHAYGYARFAQDAVAAGVDGLLLVDMPPEEATDFLKLADKAGLKLIFLLAPTSDSSRVSAVADSGRGFVYYVTVTGVTGARKEVSTTLASELDTIRRYIKIPVVAGFGVSTPEQAAAVATAADGVVVGSAIVRLFQQYSGLELEKKVEEFVTSLKKAIAV